MAEPSFSERPRGDVIRIQACREPDRGMLTHRAKAKHPNAARLFAHYVMSPDGNKIFNADPGSLSVYDTSGLPRQYESPKPNAIARRARFATLLGAP